MKKTIILLSLCLATVASFSQKPKADTAYSPVYLWRLPEEMIPVLEQIIRGNCDEISLKNFKLLGSLFFDQLIPQWQRLHPQKEPKKVPAIPKDSTNNKK